MTPTALGILQCSAHNFAWDIFSGFIIYIYMQTQPFKSEINRFIQQGCVNLIKSDSYILAFTMLKKTLQINVGL